MVRRNYRRKAVQAGLLIIAALSIGGCSSRPKHLTLGETKVCRAQGGYESHAPFGYPFCQFSYGDAGKACSGKADCQGKCLFDIVGTPRLFEMGHKHEGPKPGDVVTGKCQEEHDTFGCYATVEGGKLSNDEACFD
jgi:hypothetical protein